MSDWINDKAVYRTAPATPGLLNSRCYFANDFLYTISFLNFSHKWDRQLDAYDYPFGKDVLKHSIV